jgi:hypothetical protein
MQVALHIDPKTMRKEMTKARATTVIRKKQVIHK